MNTLSRIYQCHKVQVNLTQYTWLFLELLKIKLDAWQSPA